MERKINIVPANNEINKLNERYSFLDEKSSQKLRSWQERGRGSFAATLEAQ